MCTLNSSVFLLMCSGDERNILKVFVAGREIDLAAPVRPPSPGILECHFEMLHNTENAKRQYNYWRTGIHTQREAYIYLRKRACAEYSEAKRAFGVNPSLLSSNKCRPHLSTYITHGESRKGWC